MMLRAGWKFGVDVGDGETRYVNNTNGGPVFVYVKDDKIVRITPIDFDERRCALLDDRSTRKRIHSTTLSRNGDLLFVGMEIND